MLDKYAKVEKHLEEMYGVPKDFESGCMLSQAISLKRIADALEKLTAVPTMPQLTEEQEKEFKKEWDAMAGNVIFNKS